tara:strand:- start:1121 stop:1375 length:255 start_codon:yes stop_codon:yes gene_type:complete
MINKITITIIALIVFIQSSNAKEKNNELSQKLNQFWKCINEEIETKNFQIKKWNERKNQTIKTSTAGEQKMIVFFSDFPKGDKT